MWQKVGARGGGSEARKPRSLKSGGGGSSLSLIEVYAYVHGMPGPKIGTQSSDYIFLFYWNIFELASVMDVVNLRRFMILLYTLYRILSILR